MGNVVCSGSLFRFGVSLEIWIAHSSRRQKRFEETRHKWCRKVLAWLCRQALQQKVQCCLFERSVVVIDSAAGA